MAGSLIQLYPVNTPPTPPPVSAFNFFIEGTTLYIQDSFGNLYAFGSTTAINQLIGDVTAVGPGTATATVVALQGSAISSTPPTDAQMLLWNMSTSKWTPASMSGNATITDTGVITVSSAGSAVNFTGSLSGDVTGTQSATVVSFVDTYTAAAVGVSVAATQSATPSNIASTIVERNASGNFSANIITAALNGNASTATNATTAVNFTGSLSGDVTGTQSATAISDTVVTGKLLTGYVSGTNTPITATNSILTAFENLQAQISSSVGSAITQLTGDGTATGPGSAVFTLATVNSNVGSFGSSTAIPSFTVNAKGLITVAGSSVVIAPAGTLTGTVLASNVVTSSLTSVGTITSGVWNGTALTAPYMLALPTNQIYVGNISNQPAAVVVSGDVGIVSSGATTIQSIQGTAVTGTTGSGNVVFSNAPTLTGLLSGGSASFSSTISASNFSGSSSGTNTGDVTTANTNSINLSFTSGQNGLNATLNLSASGPDAGYIPALSQIKTDGLLVEVLAGLPVNIGTTNSIGSAASAARSDHVHALTDTITTGQLLTGYVSGTNTPITATNSILTAFENLQAQVSASVGAAITSLTGDVLASGPGAASATVTAIQGHSVSTAVPTDAQLLIWVNGTSKWTPASLSGDASLSDTGAFTFATVNSNVGSFGSSTAIPSFTVNGKGLITAASTNVVIAPAGTLTGTVLASNVVTSSLTSVGTITSGVWNGTPLTAPYMLALPTNNIYVGNVSNQPAAVTMSGDVGIVSSGATTIQSNVVSNSKLAQMPTLTLKGNNTGITANALDLTVSQVNTMLGTVTAIGSIDTNANSNGLFISGNALSTQSASISNPGMVNNATQSFSGNKTFTGQTAVANATTTAFIVNTTSLVVDATNNTIGIGVQPQTSSVITTTNSSGAAKPIWAFSYGTGSTTGLRGDMARGTSSSPTATQTGDVLNFVSGRGYGASQFAAASTGVVQVVAGENFTNTSNQTYVAIKATPTGSVTSAEHLRISGTGVTLGPQSSGTDLHTVNGGWIRTTKTITANYTVDTTTTDDIILCNQSAGITITLPTATVGRTIVIKDISGNAQTNPITLAPALGTTNIEGLNVNKVLYTSYGSWTFSVGSAGNWWMI